MFAGLPALRGTEGRCLPTSSFGICWCAITPIPAWALSHYSKATGSPDRSWVGGSRRRESPSLQAFLPFLFPPFWNVRRAPVTCQAVSLALGYSSVDSCRGISVFSGLYRGPLRDCPVPFLLQALTTQLLWLLNTDSVPTSHACRPPPSPTKPGAQRLMKTDTRESGDCAPCTHQSRLEAF